MTILTPIHLIMGTAPSVSSGPVGPVEAPSPWSRAEFEKKLREKEKFYHIHHEFHLLMNSGKLEKPAIQGWVANRYYYQAAIPMKDSAVMSNCADRETRRKWVQRVIDHDGAGSDEGGLEAWIRLGEAVDLTREELCSFKHVLPGVKFAVEAYVNFARRVNWQEAACSSHTELFAPKIHRKRLEGWPTFYPWIKTEGYEYFRRRLSEAPRDVVNGLQITLDSFTTRAEQEHALQILQFKLDVLWSMLDAMWMAYVAQKPPYFNVSGIPGVAPGVQIKTEI